MTGPDWSQLEPLVVATTYDELVTRLGELDDAGRKALVKPMRAYSRSSEYNSAPFGSEPGLSLVGAAVLPDVRSTAAWLRRYPPTRDRIWRTEPERLAARGWPGTAGHLVEVLLQRRPSWLPFLVQELAERHRFNNWDRSEFTVIEELRCALGLEPPEAPAYVAEWVLWGWGRGSGETGSEVLRREPEWVKVVPLVFGEDAIAARLRETRELMPVVTDGSVDRGDVLDAAVARLQRGGRPKATNDFVAVLEQLAPTGQEVAARLADHLALLSPGSASTVAAYAQAALLRAHDAGAITGEDVLTASESLLARSEKKVLRTQLGWLEQYARGHPDAADRLSAVVSVALASEAVDVRQRAEKLLASLGDAPVPAPVAAPSTLPPPGVPRPVEPLGDLDEVVERFLVILRSEASHTIGLDLELVMEGLPRLAGPDGADLRAASHRFIDDPSYVWSLKREEYGGGLSVRRGVAALAAASMGDQWPRLRDRQPGYASAPELVLAERLFDLAAALARDPAVRVVSLPTDDTGAVAPEVLDDRLRAAADAGWEPAPLDLEQARLRAGIAGHPPPVVTVELQEYHPPDPYRPSWQPAPPPLLLTRVRVATAPDDTVDPDSLWSLLAEGHRHRMWGSAGWSPESHYEAWPLALPRQAEVITAHLVPELARGASSRCQGLQALLRLAETGEPIGGAMTVAVAHLLNGAHTETRAAGVDAVLALAARERLDGAALGARLAAMVLQGEVTAKRLAGPLMDAARAGAAAETWSTFHRLLADLLADGQPVTGMVDLLTGAAAVAELVPGPTPISGLAELAARKGRSGQVLEARRLAGLLTG